MLNSAEQLKHRAQELKLHGVLANWSDYASAPWLSKLLRDEEQARQLRSLERRLRNAKVGSFKMLADFDWSWPKEIDRELVEELFTFSFLDEHANVVLLGPNGVGKTTLAQNLIQQAVLRGHTARFVTASELLNDLDAQDSSASLTKRLRRYCGPEILAIDEIGYLSYGARHADLLFEVVSRRSLKKSTIITTNKSFEGWAEVFPNASSVVALIDRLVQRAEIVKIVGESYRQKEAKERAKRRRKAKPRARKRGKKG